MKENYYSKRNFILNSAMFFIIVGYISNNEHGGLSNEAFSTIISIWLPIGIATVLFGVLGLFLEMFINKK